MRITSHAGHIVGILLLVSLLAALIGTSEFRAAWSARGRATYYVSPAGSDLNDGTTAGAALKTIQKALDLAQPGDTVSLAAGVYMEDVVSRRDGAANAPIVIEGQAGSVVKGGGGHRIVQINHDYITLEGFTIDGLWGALGSREGYRDKLLYAIGTRPGDGITGLRLLRMSFKNAGGECVRLRYFAQHNEIAHSTFAGCGVYHFKFESDKKNGEAIYIGTAPEQRGDGENPTAEPDQSNGNWVHHNTFDTQGNECVDIKEGASGNIVEYNRCTGQRDPKSGGLDARGSNNIIRYNESFGNVGAGIRLGGDTAQDGLDNLVYGNHIHDNQAGGIKILALPQQQVCDNRMSNNAEGDLVGADDIGLDPAAPCEAAPQQGAVAPTAPATVLPTVAPTAEPTAPPTVVPTAIVTREPQTFHPTLDTYITADSPDKSFADEESLKVDQTPETWSLLRFELPEGAAGRVELQLYVYNRGKQGGVVYTIPTDWDQRVTWRSRPELGARVADLGAVPKGQWIAVDVSQAARESGLITLAIVPESEDSAGYRSSEGGTTHAPALVIGP
jgi:hypothetical protein